MSATQQADAFLARDRDRLIRAARLSADLTALQGTGRRCGHTPPGMLSAEPLHKLICILPPHHLNSLRHRNTLGQEWGEVVPAIKRVPERRPASW